MKVVLKAEETAFSADVSLDIQSISSTGLVVLSSDRIPGSVDSDLQRLGYPEEGTPLCFVAEVGERQLPLKARLVWLERSEDQDDGSSQEVQPRLELIVDTAEEPGWQEVRDFLAQRFGL